MKFHSFYSLTAATATSAALAAANTPAVAGPSLETFVMATNGQSSVSTYRDPDPTFNNFDGLGGFVPITAISDPSGLAAAGVNGTWRLTSSAAVPILSDALSTTGSADLGPLSWNYSGSTAVQAQYGQLKSGSHALHQGGSTNSTVNMAESYGIMSDTFTVTSPGAANGTNGTMRIGMTLDGTLSVVGTGRAGIVFRYGYGGSNPVLNRYLLETAADIFGNGFSIYGPHSYLGSFVTPPGFAYNIGPVNGVGQPSFITFGGAETLFADVPIVYGTSIDVRFGLYTFTGIGNGNGNMDVDFYNTATMTSIEMRDSGGNPVSTFSIASGSGTFYDANGAQLAQFTAAPEPATLGLLASGLLTGGLLTGGTASAFATCLRRVR